MRTVEHVADVGGDGGAVVEAGDESLGILLEVELAALPGHAGEDGRAGLAGAGMGVTEQELDAVQAARLEGGEEGSPVDFGFTQGRTDA